MGGRGNAAGILILLEALIARHPWRAYFQNFTFPYHFYGPDDYVPWLAQAALSPLRIELIDKDMVHTGREGLAGWLRTTWQPYLSQIPATKQNQFLAELVDDYVKSPSH
jgi:trans-aconitate methyltransferase